MFKKELKTKNNFLPIISEIAPKNNLMNWKTNGKTAKTRPIVTISIFLSIINNGITINNMPLIKEFSI